MLDTIISILGGIGSGLDIYEKVGAIFKGNKSEEYLKQIASSISGIKLHIERLSDNILYASDLKVIHNVNYSSQKYITNIREIREGLEPLQFAIREDILSSAVIPTPDKMLKSMKRNPWEILEHITPLDNAVSHSNPNKVPILFQHNNRAYIGWQMKGILPLIFDCSFDEVGFLKNSKGITLLESIGLETKGGQFCPLLRKGTKIPVNIKKIFSTAYDNQPAIAFRILQGDNELAEDNRLIGNFELLRIPPAPSGVPIIEISFFIDHEGTLTVSAVNIETNKCEFRIFKGINNEYYKDSTANAEFKIIVRCPTCNKAMRIPGNLYIKARCPFCKFEFGVNQGKIVIK